MLTKEEKEQLLSGLKRLDWITVGYIKNKSDTESTHPKRVSTHMSDGCKQPQSDDKN